MFTSRREIFSLMKVYPGTNSRGIYSLSHLFTEKKVTIVVTNQRKTEGGMPMHLVQFDCKLPMKKSGYEEKEHHTNSDPNPINHQP